VPAPVVKRAAHLLATLEKSGPLTESAELPLFAAAQTQHDDAVTEAKAQFEPTPPDRLREALAEIDPERLTARQALESLYRLKDLVSGSPAADSLAS
jgi:DNA mismatch repair protein MutS